MGRIQGVGTRLFSPHGVRAAVTALPAELGGIEVLAPGPPHAMSQPVHPGAECDSTLPSRAARGPGVVTCSTQLPGASGGRVHFAIVLMIVSV